MLYRDAGTAGAGAGDACADGLPSGPSDSAHECDGAIDAAREWRWIPLRGDERLYASGTGRPDRRDAGARQAFHWVEPRGLDALIDELDEHLGSDEALGEPVVELSSRLGGYGFVGGFALLLEGGNLFADRREHVVGIRELHLVADRAVAGDDDRGVGSGGEVALGGADHAVDVASGGVVDERIRSVEPCVAGVEDVGAGEVDGDVRVGVGGIVVLQV